MKVKVNIREFIEENTDQPDSLLAHASVDVDDLFEMNGIPEEQEIDVDLDELLAESRRIAHVWDTGDVRQLRPALDDDQAWAVLQVVDEKLEHHVGITCEMVERIAEVLYPVQPRHWQGRIDIRITDADGYGQDEVLTRMRDMADLLAKDMPDIKADVDLGSVRVVAADQTINP
jgi:hypothetical protein